MKRTEDGNVVAHHFELTSECSFPGARSKCGVSKEEVAFATRGLLELRHPEKLIERTKIFMHETGWELIWTPHHTPKFQLIELF